MQPRPLSPHLQIYRPQLTSVLSIMHRMAGVCLALGSVVIVWYLWCLAGGAGDFGVAQAFLQSWPGRALYFLWTVCAFYHLSNGVRHLFWDAGFGLELRTVYLSGWAVLASTVLLTCLLWLR